MVLSLLGFALGPRFYVYVHQERFRKQFNNQYPQVVSSLASSQRAGGTLLDSIRYVATEFPAPTNEVFGQIARYTENNMPLFTSIHQVANDYKLPELQQLADAVRTIQGLGGGEKAGEILEGAAEGIHWQRRFEQLIKAGTTKIRQTGLIATMIPVLLFVYFAMDPSSEYRMALYDPASQVWLGVGVIATLSGWGITQYMIKKAKEL
jgi:Flp pilus assembly protein TadB